MRWVLIIIFLGGCSPWPQHYSLDYREEHSLVKVALSDDLELSQADLVQLSNALSQHHLVLEPRAQDARYFITSWNLQGDYKDLYSESFRDVLYMNVQMTLELQVLESYSQSQVLKKHYRSQRRLTPNEDFFSNQDWYQAQMQFEIQQQLFESLASDLSQSVKRYAQSS